MGNDVSACYDKVAADRADYVYTKNTTFGLPDGTLVCYSYHWGTTGRGVGESFCDVATMSASLGCTFVHAWLT